MKSGLGNIINNKLKSPPSRGAWIEMSVPMFKESIAMSPPSRGAWIEITIHSQNTQLVHCRPPRGGRGLKSSARWWGFRSTIVAPLAGGVD